MRENTVDMLLARYEALQHEASFEAWRQLSQDVLTALVDQQGLVIALQRKALENQRFRLVHDREERAALRMRAASAFAVVQRLHQLRRKVHALLGEMRNTYEARQAMTAYARAS